MWISLEVTGSVVRTESCHQWAPLLTKPPRCDLQSILLITQPARNVTRREAWRGTCLDNEVAEPISVVPFKAVAVGSSPRSDPTRTAHRTVSSYMPVRPEPEGPSSTHACTCCWWAANGQSFEFIPFHRRRSTYALDERVGNPRFKALALQFSTACVGWQFCDPDLLRSLLQLVETVGHASEQGASHVAGGEPRPRGLSIQVHQSGERPIGGRCKHKLPLDVRNLARRSSHHVARRTGVRRGPVSQRKIHGLRMLRNGACGCVKVEQPCNG